MALINTTSEIKTYIGRAVNKSLDFENGMKPFVEMAYEAYLRPAFGDEFLDWLQEEMAGTPSADANAILPYIQRPLAWYAYLRRLEIGLGQDGDNGFEEIASDKTMQPRMWVFNKRMDAANRNAAEALEQALAYLYKNKANYEAWTESSNYTDYIKLFVNNGTAMKVYLPQTSGSYRLFLTLRNYFNEAQNTKVADIMGAEQYASLQTKLSAGTNLTSYETALLTAAAKAVAKVGYAESIPHLNIIQTDGGALRIISDYDGIINSQAATPKQIDYIQEKATTEANAALNELKKYLIANALNLPIYADSAAYEAVNPFKLPDNTAYKGVFRWRR